MAESIMVETKESRIYRLRWWTLIVLALSTLVVSLNANVLNVALPTIQSKLDATSTQLQWIVNTYMMIAGALLLSFGALSDRLGRARVLQAGLVVFCLANLGAVFSTNATHLIIARAFMGVSVALMQSCVLAIITNLFPQKERGKAIGVWSGIVGSGIALGSIIGGAILETLGWRWIFVFNVNVAAIAFVLGWFLVPDSRGDRPRRLDLFGNALFLAGIASLIYGLNNAGSHGWTDPVVLATILSSVVALGVFVLWERRTAEPLLDMSFFRSTGFSTSLAALGILYFCFVGIHYLFTFYMQSVKGYTPLETGERLIPLAVGGLIGSVISDRVATGLGIKRAMSLGFVGQGIVLSFVAFLTIDTPFWQVGAELFFLGLLNGCAIAPIRTMLMGSLPRAKAGIGSAMNIIPTYVMGSIGVAALGSLLTSIYSNHFLKAVASIPGLPATVADKASNSVAAAVGIAGSGQISSDLATPLAQAAKHSFMDGWQIVAIVISIVSVAGAAICQWVMPGRSDGNKDTAVANSCLSSPRKEHPEG